MSERQSELTLERKGHLTVGHKANVLKSDVLFRDICLAEAKAAGVPCSDKYIDALSLDVLQHPNAYDVVVTTNIFGDILSDVASYLVGGLGLVPSANIGDRYALFEPVHGSAPDIRREKYCKSHCRSPECSDAYEASWGCPWR